MLVPRRVRLHEGEHLDLVELVDAEHPACVLARRAGLPTEAGREARVAQRELVQLLARVQRGEGNLGCARQEQALALEGIDVRAVGREEARAVHRLLAHEDRRDDGRESRLREMVERELVEGHRDARRVADDVAEARARHARCALHVETADLRVLPRLRKCGGLADAT